MPGNVREREAKVGIQGGDLIGNSVSEAPQWAEAIKQTGRRGRNGVGVPEDTGVSGSPLSNAG